MYAYNRTIDDTNELNNPYSNVLLDSKFYTVDTLCNSHLATESPLYLSINIQSLNSKHAELSQTITELLNGKVKIDLNRNTGNMGGSVSGTC
jgi:hypothetical protein